MANLYELRPAQQVDPLTDHTAAFRFGRAHKALILSFILVVLVPIFLQSIYLFGVAQDRFVSHSGFSIGAKDSGGTLGLLDGLTGLSGGANTDAAIVYDFLKSAAFVSRLQMRVDLSKTLSPVGLDSVFWPPPKDQEAALRRWSRLMELSLDSRSGVISARVSAFDADDAQQINQIMLDEASIMLAGLSRQMRRDSTVFATSAVAAAEGHLTESRNNLTAFRTTTRILSPEIELESKLGLLATLQTQQIEAQIAHSLLLQTTTEKDPRAVAASMKISVIEGLLEDERRNVGANKDGSAAVTAEFEARMLEVEYAQERYLAAMAALDTANALAQQNSRYLAVHIQPTLPDTAGRPYRWRSLLISVSFLTLIWVIGAVGFYGRRNQL